MTIAANGDLVFIPLGGAGEIGMNLNLYGYGTKDDQSWVMVDLGVTFNNGTQSGVDLIMPDPTFIEKQRKDLLALVLTHAHEDHLGAVPYLWRRLKCPIYATPFTASLLRGKLIEANLINEVEIIVVPLQGRFQVGPFDFELITLTHSILEPNALAIRTPVGTVLHTGDWKFDPDPVLGDAADEEALRALGDEGVRAIVCDSTNVFNEGRAGSELDVRENLLKIIEKKTKKVIVTSFASNVARMETIFYCAKKTGRHISLVGRSMHRIYKAAKQCGYLDGLIKPIDPRDAKKIQRDKIIYLCTGTQGEPMGATNRIVNGVHPDVHLESGDTIIFSSKIIPGNEKKLYQLQNIITKNDVEIITEENAFVHVSGHPNREDLKDMYSWVKPNCIIPVHGEHRHMKEHVSFAKKMQIPETLLIENGDIVRLAPGKAPIIIDKAPTGKIYLDGNIPTSEDSLSIKQRKNLSLNGYLEITLIVTNNGKLKKPVISYKGIPEESMNEVFIFEMEDEINNICRTFSFQNKNQEKNLIDMLKQNCKKIIKNKTGKKPYTNINIARI